MSSPESNASPAPVPAPPRPLKLRRVYSGLRWVLQPFIGLLLVVGCILAFQLSVSPPHRPAKPFFTSDRLPLLAKQTAIVGVGALGMTIIIVSGGIDLSAASLLALTSVVLAAALRAGLDPGKALLLTLVIGALAGAANGVLVTSLRLVPFIVTLGTMAIYRGAAIQLADRTKIDVANSPKWLSGLLSPPQNAYQLVATGVWLVIALGLVLACVMRYTVFGRHVVAIGSNEIAARLSGIRVAWTKIAIYAIGGLFMAVAGILNFSYQGAQGDPTTRVGYELDMIAAVVIGGGSLSGGRGSVVGSILGALTMTTLSSGCDYAQQDESITRMIIGAIIIAAVALDQFTQRRQRT